MTSRKPSRRLDPTFAYNAEQRLPCVLLLDTSGSMAGGPIDELNRALDLFLSDLQNDALASKRVEIAVVTFGGSAVMRQSFTSVDQIATLSGHQARGGTPLGAAIQMGLTALDNRKAQYRSNGIAYLRPWAWVISDGQPNDDYRPQADALRAAEQANQVVTFTLGVGGADVRFLASLGSRPPLELAGLDFKAFFLWLSRSLRTGSTRNPGDDFNPGMPAATRFATVKL